MKHYSSVKTVNRESGLLWHGDTLPTRLLLTSFRAIPYFRGKGLLFRWITSLFFDKELRLSSNWGMRLNIYPNDFIGHAIAFEGGYEPRSLALAARIMSNGGVFVDVGCNFGLYTLSMAGIPGVQCIAIDASFVALAKLNENLKRNPGINAAIVSCALTTTNAVQCFEVPSQWNLGMTRVADMETQKNPSRFWAAGVPLQQVLARLAPGRIRLLKIDVEGFELSVFRGLDFEGPFRPDNLIVECDPEGFRNAPACFEFLISKGYEAMSIEGKVVQDCRELPEKNVWFRCASNEQPSTKCE